MKDSGTARIHANPHKKAVLHSEGAKKVSKKMKVPGVSLLIFFISTRLLFEARVIHMKEMLLIKQASVCLVSILLKCAVLVIFFSARVLFEAHVIYT